MTSDDLREAYRALQSAGSAQCPTDDELAALVLGEIAPARRAELADHVIGCSRCSESAGVLFETHREAGLPLAPAAVSARRRGLSLLAAAAALVVIGLLVARSPERPVSADRGLPARTAGLLPADGSELDAPPARFAWPPGDQAEGYRLRLYGDGGDVVWESERVAVPAADVPAAVRSRLEARRSYYWIVDVEGPISPTRLGPFAFRVGGSR